MCLIFILEACRVHGDAMCILMYNVILLIFCEQLPIIYFLCGLVNKNEKFEKNYVYLKKNLQSMAEN